MEKGESSGFNSPVDDIWAKLVGVGSSYSDIELRSTEVIVCSEMMKISSEKREWCKITRENDQISALMQNKSENPIIVDGMVVQVDDAAIIRCGSEIILGPEANGFRRYMFKVMPTNEICKNQLKIVLDPENAKCSICLSVWHDVVTVAPCLHNFCNGCFSMWSKRCQDKSCIVQCPECRTVVESFRRNHFLHSIEEDILKSDSSLRRSDEEIAALDSYSSIKLPPASDQSLSIQDLKQIALELKQIAYRQKQTADQQKQIADELEQLADQQKQQIANMAKCVTDMRMMVQRIASHADADISEFDRFRPQPLPGTEPMDTDNQGEHSSE